MLTLCKQHTLLENQGNFNPAFSPKYLIKFRSDLKRHSVFYPEFQNS